jgi:hypothetical protein
MYNDKDKPKIKTQSGCVFPSQIDSFDTKKSEEYGLLVARAIESEWFARYNQTSSKCRFYTQREQIQERRIYAKGLQSMEKYKAKLGTNGDTSFLNLSTKPITIIPKLVNVVANGFSNRDYSIRAFAIDPISQENRMSYRTKVETDMLSKDLIVKAKEELGVDIASMPLDKLPETSEELELHMQLEYKQSIEMSEELAIETVFQENRFNDTTQKQCLKDLIICGVSWAKNRFVKDRGIVLEYVDVENKIQSYSEDPFFRDCFYHGEFKTVLISDVLVEYPWINEYSELKKQLEYSGTNWWNYHNIQEDQVLKGKTNLLYFTYKTTREKANKIKIKKNGGKTAIPTTYKKGEAKRDDYKIVSAGVEEVLFEGVYVLGTDILLKWEVSENMSRPNSNKQKVIDQYVGIAPEREKGYIDSLVARMIPIEDKLNFIELKAEQIIQRISPDGYNIDVDALAELDLGDGKALTPLEHFDMLLQTGSVFTRSYGAGGEYNYAKNPISELKTGDSLNKLQSLSNQREIYLNLMRDVIGLNKASDASSPDKDSLVGLQKLAALNSNTATRHILDATNDVVKRIAEAITYRVADLLKYSDLKEDFARKVGATAVIDLEYVKNLHLHDFAIFLDLAPDDEEKAKLEADLTNEINKGALGVEDKYKILNIKNIKMATAYLAILKKKRAKIEEERKAREYEMQTQSNIQSSQAAEQAKQQTAQMEAMIKAQLQQAISQGELAKEQARGEQDRMTEELKAKNKIELQYVINSGSSQKIQEQEDRKDKRTLKEATAQSEMIEQRKENQGPIDFEARENQLDVFNTSNI